MSQVSFLEKLYIPKYDDRQEVIPGKVVFDHEKCSGCALCSKICPASALVMEDKKPKMVDMGENECMGCADCVAVCPEDAVKFVSGFRIAAGRYKTIDRGDIMGPRL